MARKKGTKTDPNVQAAGVMSGQASGVSSIGQAGGVSSIGQAVGVSSIGQAGGVSSIGQAGVLSADVVATAQPRKAHIRKAYWLPILGLVGAIMIWGYTWYQKYTFAVNAEDWIVLHNQRNVKDYFPPTECSVEFDPSWLPVSKPPHQLPFEFWYSDVCYGPREDLPLAEVGAKVMREYSKIGSFVDKQEYHDIQRVAWHQNIADEKSLHNLISASAWLTANGNIFDSSQVGPADADLFRFGAKAIFPRKSSVSPPAEFTMLVDQSFYTLKIESDSFFLFSDVEELFTNKFITWLGRSRPFIQHDLMILNTFAEGMRIGFLTLAPRNISEWNMVHLDNIHRVICYHLNPEDRGRIRSTGMMKTGERVCSPLGWEVPHLMKLYINWLHFAARRVDEGCMHPLRFALDAYVNLLLIHPWDDCNGRLSRIVLIFILIKYGYPPPALEMFAQDSLLAKLHHIQESAFIGRRQPIYTQFAEWIGRAVERYRRRQEAEQESRS